MPPSPARHDSDSEDDPDYVPLDERDSSDDDQEHVEENPVPQKPEATEAEKAAQKKARDDLWASFQASVASNTAASTHPQSPPVSMVKIEKTYRFAGEIVKEVAEVPEDSPEAKKWPLWQPEAVLADVATPQEASQREPPVPPATEPLSTVHASQPASTSKVSGKRPAPRKSKTKLADLPCSSTQKAKKLSTLDKSAMDWQSHVSSHVESGVKDELEANRRGGGYLEKVDFLRRVEERREDVFDASKSAKRRRI